MGALFDGFETAVTIILNQLVSVSILIPCHRVVGSTGSHTGYAGGLKAKKALLDL